MVKHIYGLEYKRPGQDWMQYGVLAMFDVHEALEAKKQQEREWAHAGRYDVEFRIATYLIDADILATK